MKVKVLKKFKDKHNGKVYKAGDVITVSKERFAEILETALLVEEVSKDAADETKPEAK